MSPKKAGDTGAGTNLTQAEMNPKPTYGLGGAPACNKLITIRFTPKRGIVNHRQPVKAGDCVQWQDQAGLRRTLTFQKWPFTESWQIIGVPANGYSNVYHVAPVPYGSYPYVPDPMNAAGPPSPPDLVVGG